MTRNQRIKELIQSKGYKVNQVDKALGQNTRLYKILREDRPIADDLIDMIIDYLDLSKEESYYFMFGQPMSASYKTGNIMGKWIQNVERELSELRLEIDSLKNQISSGRHSGA